MADWPVAALDGKTPLAAASTPNMDRIAYSGVVGTARTIPLGMPPGSDVANIAVLGYDPAEVYTGRSPIEAAGMGVELGPDDVAFRCNLVTLCNERINGDAESRDYALAGTGIGDELVMADFAGGHPTNEEAGAIMETLADELGGGGLEFHKGVSYRHLMVWRGGMAEMEMAPPHDLTDKKIGDGLPTGAAAAKVTQLMERSVKLLADHPVNQARREAGGVPINCIWLWGQGIRPRMGLFMEQYGLSGAMITAVDLLRGIGASVGFEVINVPGATGFLDTNYRGKAEAALKALETVDIVYLHVEAPDEAGHQGSLENKLTAIEDFDSKIVGPVLAGLDEMGPYGAVVLPDHYTPLELKTHSEEAVPFALMYSDKPALTEAVYTEEAAGSSGIVVDPGHELMGKFIRGELVRQV
jgi:2,3-bisphosphoglycerate-independent phosphoglycerate mutase